MSPSGNRFRVRNSKRRAAKRRRIADEQGWLCHWCGIPMADQSMLPHSATTDHLIPLSKGGSNRRENLVAACKQCNEMRADNIVFDRADVPQQEAA